MPPGVIPPQEMYSYMDSAQPIDGSVVTHNSEPYIEMYGSACDVCVAPPSGDQKTLDKNSQTDMISLQLQFEMEEGLGCWEGCTVLSDPFHMPAVAGSSPACDIPVPTHLSFTHFLS